MPRPNLSESLVQAKRESLHEFGLFRTGQSLHPKWPLEVFLEISNVCDLQCAMCPTFSGINPSRQAIQRMYQRGFMDTDAMSGSLDPIFEHALIVHAFGYGEPTLHPGFPQLLDYLARFGVMVDFFSHGNHLSVELCDLLVARHVSKLTISLSGSSQDSYESVYLGGRYEDVISGLARLMASRKRMNSEFPRVEINSIGFRHHVLELPLFVRQMADVGVHRIHLKPLVETDSIRDLHGHAANPNDADVRAAIAAARAIAKQRKVRLDTAEFENSLRQAQPEAETPISISMFPSRAKSMEMKRAMRDLSRDPPEPPSIAWENVHFFPLSPDKPPCLEPFKTLYVSQDGSAFPCCFKNDQMKLGNIHVTGASDIWREQFRDLREHIAHGKYPEELCGQCVAHSLYPKNHGADGLALRYGVWFRKAYGRPFDVVAEALAAVRYATGRFLNRDENRLVIRRYDQAGKG